MNLEAIKFCRFKGEKSEWSVEGKPQDGQFQQWLTLRDINLIVGKNATGKSRTIDAIRHIADLVSSDVKLSQLYILGFGTAEYHLKFSNNGEEVQYYLNFKEGKVIQESLTVGKIQRLNRAESKLYYEEIKEDLGFQIDEDILAVTKRDKKQHSFFEDLYSWGKNLNHYRFGQLLGKDTLLKDVNAVKDDKDVNLKDGDDVATILIKGKREYSDLFVHTIIEDMERLSYNLKEINASPLKYFPVSAFGLNVQENDLQDTTDQREMSQGMFRALSLLVQLNYSLLSKIPSCILIDDIGEGLDYDRSKGLIDLIIEKVKGSFVQVLMTTNDRFVMNKIPLDYWSVIERIPKKSLFYNYQNSKETFDEYKYSGLSNFDFLATDFYLTGFEKEESL
jgi:predicted ATPase